MGYSLWVLPRQVLREPKELSGGVCGVCITGAEGCSNHRQHSKQCPDDNRASNALMTTEFKLDHRVIRSEQKEPNRNLALDRLEKDIVAQAIGKETEERQVARRKV